MNTTTNPLLHTQPKPEPTDQQPTNHTLPYTLDTLALVAVEEEQLLACKHCHVCNMIKPLGDFDLNARTADGHSLECNACAAVEEEKAGAVEEHTMENTATTTHAASTALLAPLPAAVLAPPPATIPPAAVPLPTNVPTKECPRCNTVKATTDFFRNRARPDGLFAICKACFQVRQEEKKRRAASGEVAPRKRKNGDQEEEQEGGDDAAGLRRSVRARENPGLTAAQMLAAIDLMLHAGASNGYVNQGRGDAGHRGSSIDPGSATTVTDDGQQQGVEDGGDGETRVKRCKACGQCLAASHFYSAGKNSNKLSTNCRTCTSLKNRERARLREHNAVPVLPSTKVCRNCKQEKPSDSFYRNKGSSDGLFARCKECSTEQRVAKYVDEPTVTHKLCRKCNIDKPATDFARNRSIRDGLYSWCRACDALKAQSRQNNEQPTAARKECGQCRQEMPARCFLKDDNTVDGLSKRCRACINDAAAAAVRPPTKPPARPATGTPRGAAASGSPGEHQSLQEAADALGLLFSAKTGDK